MQADKGRKEEGESWQKMKIEKGSVLEAKLRKGVT